MNDFKLLIRGVIMNEKNLSTIKLSNKILNDLQTYNSPTSELTDSEVDVETKITDMIKDLTSLSTSSAIEVREIFTVDEWMYLIDITNSWLIRPSDYCTSNLIANIQESAEFENTDSKYDVNIKDFTNKISKLSCVHVYTILKMCKDFWREQAYNVVDLRKEIEKTFYPSK